MPQVILSNVPYDINLQTSKYSYKTFVMDCNEDTRIENLYDFLESKTSIPIRYFNVIIGKFKINYVHRFKYTFDEIFENNNIMICNIELNHLADKLQFELQHDIIENEKEQNKIKSYINGIYIYYMTKLQKFNPIKSEYFKLFSKYSHFMENKHIKLIQQDYYDYNKHYNYPH